MTKKNHMVTHVSVPRAWLAAVLVAFVCCSGCIAAPAPSPWLVGGGQHAEEGEIDPRLRCEGDNPCAANVYCDGDDDDPRCECFGGDFPACSPAPFGACIRMNADDELSCFPTADLTVGHCRAGRCEEGG
jgi:hypothetical protein